MAKDLKIEEARVLVSFFKTSARLIFENL